MVDVDWNFMQNCSLGGTFVTNMDVLNVILEIKKYLIGIFLFFKLFFRYF